MVFLFTKLFRESAIITMVLCMLILNTISMLIIITYATPSFLLNRVLYFNLYFPTTLKLFCWFGELCLLIITAVLHTFLIAKVHWLEASFDNKKAGYLILVASLVAGSIVFSIFYPVPKYGFVIPGYFFGWTNPAVYSFPQQINFSLQGIAVILIVISASVLIVLRAKSRRRINMTNQSTAPATSKVFTIANKNDNGKQDGGDSNFRKTQQRLAYRFIWLCLIFLIRTAAVNTFPLIFTNGNPWSTFISHLLAPIGDSKVAISYLMFSNDVRIASRKLWKRIFCAITCQQVFHQYFPVRVTLLRSQYTVTSMTFEWPVVSLRSYNVRRRNEHIPKELIDQFDRNLRDFGALFIVDHGIDEKVCQKCLNDFKVFFHKPVEEKLKYELSDKKALFVGLQTGSNVTHPDRSRPVFKKVVPLPWECE
uniref:Non-haem dioxygenase N-terminal domain-containing protein n=1 Tax=Romanomermis culicivorax TaxID=13658 RepID=A0A915HIW9_ROMCU